MDANTSEQVLDAPAGAFKREAGAVRARLRALTMDKRHLRRVLMIGGAGVFLVVGLLAWLTTGRYTGTDNAYVRAAKLLVTTDVSGLVASVDVKEGQAVKAGQILFRLDPVPFQIALDNAKAKYAQALYGAQSMKTDYGSMLRDIDAQRAQVDLDQRNFDRDAALLKSGNVSKALYDQMRLTLEADMRKLQSLQQQSESQLAKLGGNADLPPESHPQALTAKAAVDEAARQLDHATVRAPFDGIATAVDSLQPGTLLISALSSFSTTSALGLVSTRDMWVDAQMKETDLTYVRVGNPVMVTVDTYPGRRWAGTVDAVSPASGGTFSILPAENASANWVKVVQRIPVRISLHVEEGAPPLRAGMSAVVEIDTGHRRWFRMLFGDSR